MLKVHKIFIKVNNYHPVGRLVGQSVIISLTGGELLLYAPIEALVLTFRIEPVLACSTLPTQLYKITKPLIALVGMTIQLVQVTLKITAPLFNR